MVTRHARVRVALTGVLVVVGASVSVGCQSGVGSRPGLLRYISLGDSFPAGVGLPDSCGPCGRSPSAYPNLLARSTPLLPSLHACSGATTEDVLERARQPGEGRQVDWLAPDTDVVTITIGGNDVGFARVVGACLSGGEPCSRLDREVDARIAALRVRLDAVNEEIRRRLPSARLLVVGYPQLVADPDEAKLQGCGDLGAEEARWLREEGEALDAAMRQSAEAAGARYVDAAGAFAGHEACSTDPWITGVVAGDIGASFHPNRAGHEALAGLVRAELARG